MATKHEREREHLKIFQNKYKKKPSHPDMIGTFVDKDGVEHDVALWKLKTKQGKTYLAGRTSNKEDNRKKYGKDKEQPPTKSSDDLFDEIPF